MMRFLTFGVLAGALLVMPAAAQSTAPAPKPAAQPATPKAQPAKQDDKAAKPADAAPTDQSMTNYDVNGSNASDAMGGAP